MSRACAATDRIIIAENLFDRLRVPVVAATL
jgi:hypothetical protein